MIKIRKVMKADCDLLLEWRNNPEVYRYALNSNPIKHEEHVNWFTAQLMNSHCFFYVAMKNDQPCGVVRYQANREMTEAEVSVSVAPDFWGKGIATEMMELAEQELKKESNVKIINATVLNENTASMKLFMKADFQPTLTVFKKNI